MDESAVFASTPPYSGLLFYASGNTVYRLDFKQAGGKATAIYTHAGGKAVKMKFAKRYLSSSNAFDTYDLMCNIVWVSVSIWEMVKEILSF